MNDEYTPKRPLSEAQNEIMEKMLREVSRNDHTAVSFKLWDTLVITPFSQPEDMFAFMEEDFSLLSTSQKSFTELRTEAQKAAEKKYGAKSCVTLERIYDIFVKLSGITPAGREKLMTRECDLIHHFTFPRKCGKQLFDMAKKCRNRVIITSESIYPRDVIVKILCSCGYGEYDGIVITSEQNIPDSSVSGYLDAVVKKANADPGNILHIGGEFSRDVEAPIAKGIKAVMLQSPESLMVKSGRLRGYVQEEHIYDMDEDKFMALRCAFAVYAAYGFDIPQNKIHRSDFCSDPHMIGFMVLGPMTLIKDFRPANDMQKALISAMEKDPRIMEGRSDFEGMMYLHFGDFLGKYGSEGCQLPLEFLEKHSYSGDREIISKLLSDSDRKKWGKAESEPKLAPIVKKAPKKNGLQKFADTLFPEGTKVRNLTEGLLHGRKRR